MKPNNLRAAYCTLVNHVGTNGLIKREFTRLRMFHVKWLATIFFICVLIVSIYCGAYDYFVKLEHGRVVARAIFYRATLESFLERYQQLPYILSRDPRIIAGIDGSKIKELNTRLKDYAHKAGLEAIFLIDLSGRTIAASNSDAVSTFVGQNYGFRPYFTDAKSGKTGQYFAVGTTTSRPGYFIAEPVRSLNNLISGVIVLKLDMTALQNTWQSRHDKILVSDQNGIVVLASRERWLYKSLKTLSEKKLIALRKSRQYGFHQLDRAKWVETNPHSILFEQLTFLYAQAELKTPRWQIHLLATTQRASERAISTSIIVCTLIVSLLALAAFIRSNRIRIALLASEKANARLSAEITERNLIERRLATAQEELERINKLATLGQLAAFVTHELGQPIAALKTYIAAEELGNRTTPKHGFTFLKNVKSISERMDGITRQLRFFAQSPDQERELFDLRDLKATVESLVQHDIKAHEIIFQSHISSQSVFVTANRLRIEQVLVNFITNAISAVEGQSQRYIKLSITKKDKQAIISVTDTGVGFKGTTLKDLQEPFFTTRKSGKGLGLGLAIVSTIIREHGGSFDAISIEPKGACFCVRLPLSDNYGT